MRLWIAFGMLGVAALAFVFRRAAFSGNLDAGAVSESWLREHRAEREDPFSR